MTRRRPRACDHAARGRGALAWLGVRSACSAAVVVCGFSVRTVWAQKALASAEAAEPASASGLEGRQHYVQGAAVLVAEKYGGALAELQAVYDLLKEVPMAATSAATRFASTTTRGSSYVAAPHLLLEVSLLSSSSRST